VTIVCETDRTAKGYSFSFSAAVKDGVLHGERLTSGTPGWVAIDGPIGSDGNAMLNARGLTDVPAYAQNQVKSGTPYAYTVDAHFAGSRGTGKRIEARACALAFAKR
jgi:hypothetical protein